MVMKTRRGFTLVELLVVLAIIGTLVSLVAPRYTGSVDKAKESVLRENLATLREAIDKHYADTGKYPATLSDLVSKHYIRRMPEDPITDSTTTWVLVPPSDPQKGAIFDIKSGAPGKSQDGTAYQDW
ncbi:MAG: prepilin-type N-terminal cleavage/methylation domain-containing protein [Deltaproteobacteria bacterium]|nr:prepilin-type N-terminal cleavage/methylation domain-containing protein [Deltaproteobacteria bacterium]